MLRVAPELGLAGVKRSDLTRRRTPGEKRVYERVDYSCVDSATRYNRERVVRVTSERDFGA